MNHDEDQQMHIRNMTGRAGKPSMSALSFLWLISTPIYYTFGLYLHLYTTSSPQVQSVSASDHDHPSSYSWCPVELDTSPSPSVSLVLQAGPGTPRRLG